MFEPLAKWNAAELSGEFRDFHLLMGHPSARRSSSNDLLTSSGEDQWETVVESWDSSFLGSLGFRWRIVRRESESRFMRTKLAIELASFDVIAFFKVATI